MLRSPAYEHPLFTADVDSDTLARASEVLAREGITPSEALRRMLDYIVLEGRMPHFQCLEPNEETLVAMVEAERGDLASIGTVDDLMSELDGRAE